MDVPTARLSTANGMVLYTSTMTVIIVFGRTPVVSFVRFSFYCTEDLSRHAYRVFAL